VIARGGGLLATAANGIDLGTQVAWVDAQTAGGGDLNLNEVDGIDLRRVITADGRVTLTSGNQMNVGQVVAGGNADASLRAYSGDINFNLLSGSVTADANTVFLDAAGSIVGSVDSRDVISDRLENLAGQTITLGTEVNVVKSSSGGDTLLRDFSDVVLENVVSDDGNIEVRANGSIIAEFVRAGSGGGRDVTLTADDNITGPGSDPNVLADLLTMRAGGSILLNTQVTDVDSRSAGDTELHERDALNLRHVESFGGNILVTANGQMNVVEVIGPNAGANIRLQTTGNIDGVGAQSNVIGDNLTTVAGGSVTLNTQVNTLTSDSGGDATFNELDDVAIMTLTTPGTVNLTAGRGVTDGNGKNVVNVTAGTLNLDAVSANLDTEIADLSVNARGGDFAIREQTAVNVHKLDFASGNTGSLALRGGLLRMLIDGVWTFGGSQTYGGAMELAGAGRQFTLSGNTITLNATMDGSLPGADGYKLVVSSTGETRVNRDITADKGIEFGGGRRSRTVITGPVTLATQNSDVDFNRPLGGSGKTTITTMGGNVTAHRGINGSQDLNVDTWSTTLADLKLHGEKKLGDFKVIGASTVQNMVVQASTIDVGAVTANGGRIDLTSDPRLILDDAPHTDRRTGGATSSAFLRPSGLIKLRGDLTASGDIVLGSTDRFYVAKPGQPAKPPVPTGATETVNDVPNVATIVVLTRDLTAADLKADTIANTKFTIKGNQFEMRTLEKMTVLGDLVIDAGKATLTDISALGSLEVISEEVNFNFRQPGFLLTKNGVVGSKADVDVDFYANNGISFHTHGGGDPTINASPAGQGDKFVSFGVGPSIAQVGNFRFRRKATPSALSDFLYVTDPAKADVVVLDATPDGPSSTDISVTLTQALPQETPTPTEETNLSETSLKRLQELGVYGRLLEDQEKVEKAMGLVLYLDVLPQREHRYDPRQDDWKVVVGKLPRENTQPLLDLDDQLYGKDAQSKTAEHRQEVQMAVRTELLEAVAAFREQKPDVIEIDPAEFIAFIRAGNYPNAVKYLEVIGEMFDKVDSLGLTRKQLEICRAELLDKVAPGTNLIQRDQLEQVARGLAKERQERLAARQRGAQAQR
jgi:hypothetical protein